MIKAINEQSEPIAKMMTSFTFKREYNTLIEKVLKIELNGEPIKTIE